MAFKHVMDPNSPTAMAFKHAMDSNPLSTQPPVAPSHWYMNMYHLTIILALGTLLYGFGLVVYRIFFHPLAKFPGPKIAAATYWYECCWDIFGNGTYYREVVRMHARYGISNQTKTK